MNVICCLSQAHLQQYFLIRVVIFVALITWLFPLVGLADSHVAQHSAQKSSQITPSVAAANNNELNKTINPRSQFWRKVREGETGYSAVSGPEAGQLIESNGEVWRRIRNGPLATYGAWAMLATLAALALFYAFRGQVKLSHERTGNTLLRWTTFERFIHWYTALLFLLLTITGLSILYGRSVLIPLLGHESFAVWASWAKLIHNYTGPLFMAGIVYHDCGLAERQSPRQI